jgi:hypothetical protein
MIRCVLLLMSGIICLIVVFSLPSPGQRHKHDCYVICGNVKVYEFKSNNGLECDAAIRSDNIAIDCNNIPKI